MTGLVVTANRLSDGEVVYLAAEGRWTLCLEAALVVGKEESEELLRRAERAVAERKVVGPYAFPVVPGPEGIRPTHMKEIIRAAGPTVRRDLGKQAGLPCAAE